MSCQILTSPDFLRISNGISSLRQFFKVLRRLSPYRKSDDRSSPFCPAFGSLGGTPVPEPPRVLGQLFWSAPSGRNFRCCGLPFSGWPLGSLRHQASCPSAVRLAAPWSEGVGVFEAVLLGHLTVLELGCETDAHTECAARRGQSRMYRRIDSIRSMGCPEPPLNRGAQCGRVVGTTRWRDTRAVQCTDRQRGRLPLDDRSGTTTSAIALWRADTTFPRHGRGVAKCQSSPAGSMSGTPEPRSVSPSPLKSRRFGFRVPPVALRLAAPGAVRRRRAAPRIPGWP